MWLAATCGRDHPRVCGENMCGTSAASEPNGSPPRMRGELGCLERRPLGARITPAYAGRTARRYLRGPSPRDHPCVCGENFLSVRPARSNDGSPPRMRGEPFRAPDGRSGNGITPAYAGRTHPRWRGGQLKSDHPRVCGENFCGPRPARRPIGSPPRMRGERPEGDKAPPKFGITPAYAGRTPSRRSPRTAPQDHPRVCGENIFYFDTHGRHVGSPPRMRGELIG